MREGKPAAASRKIADWPYASAYVAETLDPDLIEQHAVTALGRAINVGRLVAFVGSGVSMTYGRLSWVGLVSRIVGEVLEYTDFKEDGDRSYDPVHEIRKNLEDMNIEGRLSINRVRGDRLPAAFQYCEQLDEAWRRWREGRGEGRASPSEREGEPPTPRQRAAQLIYDDRGHVSLMYTDLVGDLLISRSVGKEKPSPSKIRETSRWFTKRLGIDLSHPGAEGPTPKGIALLSKANLVEIVGRLTEELRSRRPPAPYDGLLQQVQKIGAEGMLPPVRRFVLTAFLRASEHFDEALEKLPPDDPNESGDALAKLCVLGGTFTEYQPHESQVRSRRIDPRRDPLALLLDGIGVRRFLTTNYDLDIETVLADQGFKGDRLDRGAPGPVELFNPLRAAARDFVVQGPEAALLLEFSIQDRAGRFDLAHLHGRADRPKSLVITEADYQRLYHSEGAQRGIVADALSLVFGSNPILFVGNGMGEDDILRPLRHFLSDRTSRDRAAVALLPGLLGRAEEIEEKAALLTRYGVHAIHFGKAGVDSRGEVRWLGHVMRLIRDLHDLFISLKEAALKAAKTNGDEELTDIRNNFEFDIMRFINSTKLSPYREIFVIPCGCNDQGRWKFKNLIRLEGIELSKLGFEIDLEMGLIEEIISNAMNIDPKRELGKSLLRSLMPDPAADRNAVLREWYRFGAVHVALLESLPDAITSAFLCARLHKVEDEWLHWKSRWHRLPVPRSIGGLRAPVDPDRSKLTTPPSFPVIERHSIALRPLTGAVCDGPHPPGDCFFAGAPSQTFDALYSAFEDGHVRESLYPVRHKASKRARGSAGWRRIIVLLSRRGVGKGHFFAALRRPERLDRLMESIAGGRKDYAGAAFFNLSFSLEVASVFDRMTSFLVDRAHTVFTAPGAILDEDHAYRIWQASVSLRGNRVGRLRRILELYANGKPSASKRILIAISGFGQLFDEAGDPKNAQIGRLVDAMLHESGRGAPIDFVLMCNNEGFPAFFRERSPLQTDPESPQPRIIALEEIYRKGISDEAKREIKTHEGQLRVAVVPAGQKKAHRDEVAAGRKDAAFIHVLRDARASVVLATFFPLVALAIAAQPGCLSDRGAPSGSVECRVGRLRERLAIGRVLSGMDDDLPGGAPSGVQRWSSDEIKQALPRFLRALFAIGPIDAARQGEDAFARRAREELDRAVAGAGGATGADTEIEADFKFLYRSFGRSRFVLSIVAAAAAEMAVEREEAAPAGWTADVRPITEFLKEISVELLGVSMPSRDDAALARVLDHHRRRHEHGAGLPPECGTKTLLEARFGVPAPGEPRHEKVKRQVKRLLETLGHPSGWRLQQSLIWHLSILGHPVDADVLVRAPEIRIACDAILSSASKVDGACGGTDAGDPGATERDAWRPRRAVVDAALDLLVHRCLVFRLKPVSIDSLEAEDPTSPDALTRLRAATGSPATSKGFRDALRERDRSDPGDRGDDGSGGDWRQERPWRFSVHRLVQRSVLRRLQAPAADLPRVDQFTLSLYVTQPDDLPRLSSQAVRDLSLLAAEWSGFPLGSDQIDRPTAYDVAKEAVARPVPPDPGVADEAKSLPARLLRAAFGMIRTVYSVAVVVRLEPTMDDPRHPAPEGGYIELYRRQIRWLLREAVSLDDLDGTPPDFSGVEGAAVSAKMPFLAEEIVWLYNECGLLSLIQGRLNDADALFERALAAAQRVEPADERGALWTRIHMNRAYVDIERGRARVAARYLRAIRGIPDEHPVMRASADGHLALIDHISGNLDDAQAGYERAIERLRTLRRARALSIFSRHLADLFRHKGAEFRSKAAEAADEALAYATKGGHEDLRRLALLSKVQIEALRTDEAASRRALPQIEEVQVYATRMGMPRLASHTLSLQATELIKRGETKHAAHLVIRSLEIAIECDLRMRQVACLVVLAETYRAQGLNQAADTILKRGYELADRSEYAHARTSIARQLARGR